MADYVQVSTAAGTRETAVELLNSAVKARLAAGGQVFGPVVHNVTAWPMVAAASSMPSASICASASHVR